MRVTRPLMLFCALAIAAGGCAQQPVMRMQMAAAPAAPVAYAPQGIDSVIYGASPAAGYAAVAVPGYGMAAATPYATAAPAYGMAANSVYATAAPPSYGTRAAPLYDMAGGSPYATVGAGATAYPGTVVASPVAYAAPAQQWPYTLDTGDRLRIVVFGQDGLTNSYLVDASGDIAMPLIGSVAVRGLTSDQLSQRVADLLRQGGYIREPHVAVEIEAYRPFFILGEVTQPGQYPYVANMTVETAGAIAGGFGPRGYKQSVIVSRNYGGQVYRFKTPITAQVQPGDTIQVQERWF